MNNTIKTTLIVLVLAVIAGGILGYNYYRKIYSSNVDLKNRQQTELYVLTGSSFDDLFKNLQPMLVDAQSFKTVAELKQFDRPKAGRYIIKNKMTNNELVNMFRSGHQEAVKLTFNNIRTLPELAGKVGSQIEADSIDLINYLKDRNQLEKHGFTPENVKCVFLPNTYQIYWNTSPEEFLVRMKKEYERFWSEERKNKAKKIGLSQFEVSVLASIVQSEQSVYDDEKPIIAGLYINRLNKNMLLQADPTLVYALGDFSIRRVLNKHKEIASPYNTYKHLGLPPGPINLPEISSIKAVLNYKKHDYIFMCAKEDFSGYHNFSKTARQHGIYARRYQQALNRKNIKR